MDVKSMQDMVMIQTNNDPSDIVDYKTEVLEYLNEGYNRLYFRHMEAYPAAALVLDTDTPDLPKETHRYIVDWATWRFYMNGNQSKQNRGIPFRNSFDEFYIKMPLGGGVTDPEAQAARTAAMRFTNLYKTYRPEG